MEAQKLDPSHSPVVIDGRSRTKVLCNWPHCYHLPVITTVKEQTNQNLLLWNVFCLFPLTPQDPTIYLLSVWFDQ